MAKLCPCSGSMLGREEYLVNYLEAKPGSAGVPPAAVGAEGMPALEFRGRRTHDATRSRSPNLKTREITL